MKPIDFGTVGILQIGNERYGFRPTEMYTEYGHAPILRGEFLPDVFAASNLRAKGVEYLNSRFGVGAVPQIKNVIFNDPATVVIWSDGTKTVVKCQPGDTYSKETGLALCIAKKSLGNKGNFNEVFKKWIPEETEPVKETAPVEKVEEISVDDMRSQLKAMCDSRECESLTVNECPLFLCCKCAFTRENMTDDEIRAAYAIAFK